MAKFHRSYLKLPIVALTGSNGKTTTKELINVVLAQKYKTKATVGNLNNHIGVPLTLLSFTNETEIGIVEMGANHKKEIEFLCEIAQPDYGYITNFGKAHLEGFGGVEGVIQGKSEMYQYLAKNNKFVFVNLEDPIQIEKSQGIKAFTFGVNKENADLKIKNITANPFVIVNYGHFVVESHLIGLYNANNINAAVTIGKYFEVDDKAVKEAIENYIPENNRSQLLKKGSNEIILDAYNANPSSMEVALENFFQLGNNNKIAILGDMFELGEEAASEHEALGNLLATCDIDYILLAGKLMESAVAVLPVMKVHYFPDKFGLHNWLQDNPVHDTHILVKGSRGMGLESVLPFLG